MTKRFIIVAQEATPAQQNVITTRLSSVAKDWWHWFPLMWIILTDHTKTSSSLRDEIVAIAPGVNFVVYDADAESGEAEWSGFASKAASDWFLARWPTTVRGGRSF